MTSKRARFVTYGEQVDLVRNAPRAAALGMHTVPGTWQSHPIVRSQRGIEGRDMVKTITNNAINGLEHIFKNISDGIKVSA